MLTSNDFKDIGGYLEVQRCPFHGHKDVYRIEGHRDSDYDVSDGYDIHYIIEQQIGYGRKPTDLIKITEIRVGGFAGGKEEEQVFYGKIKDKSELGMVIGMVIK